VLEAEIHSADPKAHGIVVGSLENQIFPISRETGTGSMVKLDGLGVRVVFADAVELP